MNDINLYATIAFDDLIPDAIPTVMIEDADIMWFLRKNATTVIAPDVITEESTAGEESTVEESTADEESTVEEESTAEWIPGEAPEEGGAFAGAEPYAAPAAGTYSSGKFSGGQSFYVPWDASYLDKFVGYMSKSVGAIVYVAIFCGLAYFGIQMLTTVIENFKNRKG